MPRVALFVPCYVDHLAPQVAMATAELLEALGCDIDVPMAQACCGQPMANLGCRDEARPLAQRFESVFGSDAFDHVVAPSGSCVAMVRHHYRDLARDAREREAWEGVAGRTFELCEFLVDVLGVEGIAGRYPHRVGLHRGCHGLRELGLASPSEHGGGQPPRVDRVARLLGSIDGLEIVPLERPDECCGFGGTFAVAEPDVSTRMGHDRLADHARAGADRIVSTDVSCSLHLAGLARHAASADGGGPALPIVHVAEVMRDAIAGEGA